MAKMNRQQRRKQQKLDRAGKKGPPRAPAAAAEIGGTAPFQMGGAASLPLAGGSGASAAAAYRRAQAARQTGRLKEAWDLCQQAIQADSKHGEAVALAGLLAWQRGDYKQALPLLQKAMKLRPKDATAISNYGAVLQSLGKLEEAISIHRKAVRAEPGYVKGHTNLASALLQAERYEESAKAFRRALDLDKGFAEAQSGLGVALQKLGQLEDAVAAHRAAVDLAPGQGILHYNLAAAELAEGDGRAALAACDAGLAQAPGDTRMLAFKVGVLEALEARNEARELLGFERLLRAAPLDLPRDCAGLEAFNASLSAAIESHRSLQFEPPTKATRGGWQTGEILSRESGPVAAFRQCLEDAVSRYTREVAAVAEGPDGHPFARRVPVDWRLKGWAVVLQSGGQQSAHIHPQAWLSGVYYVKIPASVAAAGGGQDGWIEFGRPSDDFPAAVEPVVQLVQPQAGLLVLFPSYYYHRTLPFQSDERRISFAFDVIPEV